MGNRCLIRGLVLFFGDSERHLCVVILWGLIASGSGGNCLFCLNWENSTLPLIQSSSRRVQREFFGIL